MKHVSLAAQSRGLAKGPTGEKEGSLLQLWVVDSLYDLMSPSDECYTVVVFDHLYEEYNFFKWLYKAWPSGRYNGLKITAYQGGIDGG